MSNKKANIDMEEEQLVTAEMETPVQVEEDMPKASDADMPEPETNDYTPEYKLTPMFMNLFNRAVGDMQYSTVLKNNTGEKVKLIEIVKFIEIKRDKITQDELNIVIQFLAGAQFKYVRDLMEIVEQPSKQYLLWTPTV